MQLLADPTIMANVIYISAVMYIVGIICTCIVEISNYFLEKRARKERKNFLRDMQIVLERGIEETPDKKPSTKKKIIKKTN